MRRRDAMAALAAELRGLVAAGLLSGLALGALLSRLFSLALGTLMRLGEAPALSFGWKTVAACVAAAVSRGLLAEALILPAFAATCVGTFLAFESLVPALAASLRLRASSARADRLRAAAIFASAQIAFRSRRNSRLLALASIMVGMAASAAGTVSATVAQMRGWGSSGQEGLYGALLFLGGFLTAAFALSAAVLFSRRQAQIICGAGDSSSSAPAGAQLDEELLEEAEMSFPSGHAALAFCGAACFAVYALEYAADEPATPWLVAGGFAAAAAAGVMRVLSGSHYVTDTVAGAALGCGIGWLVCRANILIAEKRGGRAGAAAAADLRAGPGILLVEISY